MNTSDMRTLLESKQGGLYIIPTDADPIPETKWTLAELLSRDPDKIGLVVNYLKTRKS